jgi:hypothetical protein
MSIALEINRKLRTGFVIAFFLFSVLPVQAQEIESVKTEEESFPEYVFKTLPKNLLLGTEKSLWGWNLGVLGVGAVSALTLSQTGADREVQDAVHGSIGDFEYIGNIAGNGFTIGGIVVSTYIAGRLIKDEKVIETGKALIESEIITGVMTSVIKVSVGRKRPDGAGNRFTSSFPSGHASASFALASTVDAMYGYKIGIPLYLFAGFASFSRLSNNSHFLSDVLFGAVLGTVVGRAVASIHKDRDNSKLSFLPYSNGNSAGLMLTMSW